jgi:hypothetical protein
MLARMMQKMKQENDSAILGLNYGTVASESTIRRNRLVLEDVIKRRTHKDFMDDTSTVIHQASFQQIKENMAYKRIKIL